MPEWVIRSPYHWLLAAVAAASLGVLPGYSASAQFFYTDKNKQAIRRDTINLSGTTSFLENPADSINGIITLAAVEMLPLQPVTLQVDEANQSGAFSEPRTMMLPTGFSISVYATGLGRVRDLAVRDDGTLFYSDIDGKVMAIAPDGSRVMIADDLDSPHGIELVNGVLYYSDELRVFRFDFESPTSTSGTSTLLTDKISSGGTNYTRTIRWVPNDKRLYISVGSSSNKDPESDNKRATVLRMGEKGGVPDVAVYGGLRNTVAMDVHPETGELWGLDNGTELLATNLPPTELNILKVGRHYGWPYYYSRNFRDPDFDDEAMANAPKNPVPPILELEPHAEALDMQFYPTGGAISEWKNSMLITFHEIPKVIRLRADNKGTNARQSDFLTGFADSEGSVWGRPVGITISKDGKTIYVSDDLTGAIYKIVKQ